MFPFGIHQGGLELQCLKTCRALQRTGIDAKLFDYYRTDDQFDLIHLFGSTENYFDICKQVVGRWPIIISAVTGAPNAAKWRGPIWQTASSLATLVKLHTSYYRMREVYSMAASVICLNQLEAEFLKTTYGVPVSKLNVIHNGVDGANFAADSGPFYKKFGLRNFVLFTGNIVQRKNPVRLAEVLKELSLTGVFIGRTISAEADYGVRFRSLIKGASNLYWIEGLPEQDSLLASAYAAADLFCLPSTNETQSLSALEAMAAGTPVLLGDYPYAYQSPFEAAWRCNPLDPSSMKTMIRRALDATVPIQHPLPDSYRWEKVAASIATLYQSVIDSIN